MATSFRASRGPGQQSARLASLAEHFRSSQTWKDRWQFNELSGRGEMLNGHDVLEPISDLHVLQIQEKLQMAGFRGAKRETVRDALTLVCAEYPYHPVRDWLIGLRGKWDGVARMNHWLVDCMDCDDSAYVQAIGRMFLIAMVARVMRPGCQADYMLVLEGSQGVLKSRLCRVLAGEAFFDDHIPQLDRDPVRTSMALRGRWLLEVSEMDSFRGARMDTLKAFVTRRVEQFTPKYSRAIVSEPRQCLFVGTVNGQFTYTDPSGARRFWPVQTRECDPEKLGRMREQLFAEAVAAFDADEQWWPDHAFEAAHIKPEQENRRHIEPWVARIEPWLAGNAVGQTHTPVPPIPLIYIWTDCLGGRVEHYDREKSLRIAEALRFLDWEENKPQRKEKTRYWSPLP